MQLPTSVPEGTDNVSLHKNLFGPTTWRAILHFTDRWRYPKYPCPKCGLFYDCQPTSRFSKEISVVRSNGALTYARGREDGVSFPSEVYLACCQIWAQLDFPPRETWFWVDADGRQTDANGVGGARCLQS